MHNFDGGDAVELILRVAAFGTFVGHGWIAAWKVRRSTVPIRFAAIRCSCAVSNAKALRTHGTCARLAHLLSASLLRRAQLEFGGWSKFMTVAGFSVNEAHVLMPCIGWMDIILGFITLVRPMQLTSAWMVCWAFSTAMIRPVSAGWKRALDPMNDNAIWGFVERAANWAVPLALLAIQKSPGYTPGALFPAAVGDAIAPLDAYLTAPTSGWSMKEMLVLIVQGVVALWLAVPFLRMRMRSVNAE